MTGTMNALYPVLGYREAEAAIAFLQDAFGFEVWMIVPRAEGGVMHAELALGDAVVLLHSLTHEIDDELKNAYSLYMVVDDIDAHCARSKAAGANVTKEPHDTDYGSRDYMAVDPEGYIWNFGTYRPSRPVS